MSEFQYSLSSLYINPTRYCNLKCCHCWLSPPYKDTYSGKEDELSANELIKVVRAAIGLGLSLVKLTGGEPLLRDDLDPLLEFCQEAKIEVIIETNGTLVDEQRARKLKRLGVSFISVSLDGGNKSINDNFRGIEGAFDLAIKGIRSLIIAGFTPQIITCLHRENLEHFDEFIELLNKLGVKDLKINTINDIGRAQKPDLKNNSLSIREILSFHKRLAAFKEKFPHRISLDIPPAFKQLEELKDGAKCGIFGILGILPKGEVSICGIGLHLSDLIFGSLRGLSQAQANEKLRDIWVNNEKLNEIRRDVPNNFSGVCGKCAMKKLCLGKCRADTYYHQGNFSSSYWFCQAAYDQGLFPQTRLMPEGYVAVKQ